MYSGPLTFNLFATNERRTFSAVSEWSHYSNVTDSGITSEIAEKNWWRKAEEFDIRAVGDLYLTRLKREIEKNPRCFQSVAGASGLIADLRSMEEVCVCIATGGWRDSALLKLEVAGIPFESVPLASSDDSRERLSIMLTAYERARTSANCASFDSVIYVADHPWDFVNAKRLGYNFLGIGNGEQAEKLRQAGAVHIQPDFTNKEYIFSVVGVVRGSPK